MRRGFLNGPQRKTATTPESPAPAFPFVKRGFLNNVQAQKTPATTTPSRAEAAATESTTTPSLILKRGFLNGRQDRNPLYPEPQPLKGQHRLPDGTIVYDYDPSKQISPGSGLMFEDTIPKGISKVKCSFIADAGPVVEEDGEIKTPFRMVLIPVYQIWEDTRFIFCSQPYPKTDILDEYPDNWSECVLQGQIKKRVLAAPGFPSRIQRPVSKTYRIGDSPGKGKGMFATRTIRDGELILDERPLMVVPSAYMPPQTPLTANYSPEELKTFTQGYRDKILDVVYRRMPRANRRAFDALWNDHRHDDVGRLGGILRTCGIGISSYVDKSENRFNYTMESISIDVYSGVCNDGSRINHSCGANIRVCWIPASFSFRFYAVREISEGEEITMAYQDGEEAYAERVKACLKYNFKCTCPHCRNPKVTDQLRAACKQGGDFAKLAVFDSYNKLLPQILELLHDKMVSAKVQAFSYYRQTLFGLVSLYVAEGNEKKAALFGRKLFTFTRGDQNPMDFCETLEKLKTHTAEYWGTGKVPTKLLSKAFTESYT